MAGIQREHQRLSQCCGSQEDPAVFGTSAAAAKSLGWRQGVQSLAMRGSITGVFLEPHESRSRRRTPESMIMATNKLMRGCEDQRAEHVGRSRVMRKVNVVWGWRKGCKYSVTRLIHKFRGPNAQHGDYSIIILYCGTSMVI